MWAICKKKNKKKTASPISPEYSVWAPSLVSNRVSFWQTSSKVCGYFQLRPAKNTAHLWNEPVGKQFASQGVFTLAHFIHFFFFTDPVAIRSWKDWVKMPSKTYWRRIAFSNHSGGGLRHILSQKAFGFLYKLAAWKL